MRGRTGGGAAGAAGASPDVPGGAAGPPADGPTPDAPAGGPPADGPTPDGSTPDAPAGAAGSATTAAGAAAGAVAARTARAVGGAALVAGTVLSAASRTARAIGTPTGVRGMAFEAAWAAVHAVLYPWGALAEQLRPGGVHDRYRTDDLPPGRRGLLIADVRAAGTPVLLVHGIVDNRSVFAVLARALRRRGFALVLGINYSVLTALTGDVRSAARELGRQVEQVCERTGADQVHVVGHSLGGLVARYYVQRLGGHARVHTLVTLGSPHAGTLSAYLLPTPVARQLRPASDVIAELAEPAPGCTTRFLVVWSEIDQMVLPQHHARLEHPDLTVVHHRLRDVGHLSLPVDPRAVHAVASALARLEPERRPHRLAPAPAVPPPPAG